MKEYIEKVNNKKYLNLVRPIEKKDLYSDGFLNDEYLKYRAVKFVPASGAASRMFSFLDRFLSNLERTKDVDLFLDNLEKFAFYEDIKESIAGMNEDELVNYILKAGLNYGKLPKALIKVHKYPTYTTNPLDEHLYEAREYLNKDNPHLHFTISKEHGTIFNEYLDSIQDLIRDVKIDYSFQAEDTNSPALDEFNNPFKLDNGEVLSLPAGHGALIENLNELDSEIIFIKNIDNVCHRSHLKDTILAKKLLASVGVKLKTKIDNFLQDIIKDKYDLFEIQDFIKNVLKINLKDKADIQTIFSILDRPFRVCGVVKNEGEPGGGPFIVDDGSCWSPQICEMSEINLDRDSRLIKQAKYFNPVDLVLMVKRYNNEKYNLLNYINHDRYLVALKTYAGKKVKYLEKPGLWNGSMHYWNTVFVEIPISTFNPIKSINDLLRERHLQKN